MNMIAPRLLRIAPALAVSLLLAACAGSDGAGKDPTGSLRLSVTDAPVDEAEAVWVQFRAVEFKPEGGPPVLHELRDGLGAPTPRSIDLLPLQDGRAAVLVDDLELPAGRYEWIRLIVDDVANERDSYLVIEGNECEMRVPSGSESGLKLIRGFTLPANGSVALTVDFDLRKSIVEPPGQQGSGVDCTQAYLLKPVLRIVQDSEVGAITGRVDPTLFLPDCSRLVYVFADGDEPAGSTIPDDQDLDDPNPVVMAVADPVSGAYRASFLPAGPYSLAFTCGVDAMDANDALVFSAVKGATVQANLITSGVDFP
jgi:Domain of unknown function (DUF4382)